MATARLSGDALRFLVAGGLNTALTSGVYFAGLAFFPSGVSFALAWFCGLLFVMALYPSRVFIGGRRTVVDRLAVGASTIVVFLIGLGSLLFLEVALNNSLAAFFATLVLTTALNFSISRWILRRQW